MFFQNGNEEGPPIFVAIPLILGSFILFTIGLFLTKAQVKRNFKWILGSFFIQFGIIFFVISPSILWGMTGEFQEENQGIIVPLVLVSIFIVIHMVNVIHKIGLKRSFVVVFLFVIPMIGAMVVIGFNLGRI